MEKSRPSFLLMDVILLFAGISFILIVFDLSGITFMFEIALLVIFLFFMILGMITVYQDKNWGWTLIGAVLILLLLDTLFVSFLTKKFNAVHMAAIAFSVIGLVVTALNLSISRKSEVDIKDEYPKVREYYPDIQKAEPKQEEVKESPKEELKEEPKKEEATIKAKKTVTAKFVASKETKKYHTSRCGWSRITKRKNRIYFDSRRKAESKGFKPHECVV